MRVSPHSPSARNNKSMMKACIGIIVLLATHATSFAAEYPGVHDKKDDAHQLVQPLFSGSVCRVNDALDFLDPQERAKVTFVKRIDIAREELGVGPTCHITNGDEENVPLFAGQFHKSLPHDKYGQVDPDAYAKLLDCVVTSDIDVCDKVPSGAKENGAKMINPLGGAVHAVDGADSNNIFIKTPSAVLSAELAAQQIEVYWMALARDIPFSQFADNDVTVAAAANLEHLPAFKGLAIAKSEGGKIDPVKDLFRTNWPGVQTGPIVSQLLLADFRIDGINVKPKIQTLVPNVDYMTAFQPWLDVQNGASEVPTEFVPEDEAVFIRNGRDFAALAFLDLIYSEAVRAAFVMLEQGILNSASGPYLTSERQVGFSTFGEPHILTAMAASSSSTRHAWYAKWQVHRVLRPEAYGGLVDNTIAGRVKTPLDDSILGNTELLNRVAIHNKAQNPDGEKTLLLPMAVAEGSPVHPAYPSGHAINVGAYITTLKAFLGLEVGQTCYPDPVVATDSGTDRIPFVSGKNDHLDVCVDKNGKKTTGLTYEGELNKVASNVIIGRSHIGVHYRMDGVEGALMGETSAIRRLQQELGGLPEARPEELQRNKRHDGIPPGTYKFRLYSGKIIEIFGGDLFRLDGKLCKGMFTGDDFCDEQEQEEDRHQQHEAAFKHLLQKGSDHFYKEF